MKLLGVSAFYHDSAACLLIDGEIVAAAQEERFTRIKHDSSFPQNALRFCIYSSNIRAEDIDFIVFYDKPFLKFERLVETFLEFAPRGFNFFSKVMPLWLKDKIFQKNFIVNELKKNFGNHIDWRAKLLFSEHHISHAASAFYPSPFSEAAILTMDGVGEWVTTSVIVGSGNKLSVIKEINFPHSLGLLYSAFTYYLGFKVNSGEYKVMGLAPYGKPVYVDKIKNHLINIKDDGSFTLDMSYFDYCTNQKMTSNKFSDLFGAPPRKPEDPLTEREMDLASSIQFVVEEIVIKIARSIQRSTGQKNLCLAGGVALNCVVNGKLLREKIFENIWIQPAAGDAGGAIGAALAVYYHALDGSRKPSTLGDAMRGSYLGPFYQQDEVVRRLEFIGAKFTVLDSVEKMIDVVAGALVDGKTVGWHQGPMEFGPRALGSRSILADPRSPVMQKKLNLQVKYRESFRPFAPSILFEHVSEWFDLDISSPYMLFVANVNKEKRVAISEGLDSKRGLEKINDLRSVIPAVTHVDYSARIQTVHQDTNPTYHALISKFYELTGCPVLVNTSFNVRGEPIVESPEDAFNCMMGTEIDILAIGNCILRREDQDSKLAKNYKNKYELD